MGKGRRKSTANKLQNISNRAAKSSEIAPKFQKTSDNDFQNALARKDFNKAKSLGQSSMAWPSTRQYLEYEFYRSFPIAINSMPVSYETASLLKCTVSMNYIRYTVKKTGTPAPTISNPNNSPPSNSISNLNFLTQQFLDQNGGFSLPSLNIG